MKKITLLSRFIFIFCVISIFVSGSVWHPASPLEQITIVTRMYEFDYIGWTADALLQKLHTASLGSVRHYSESQKRAILRDYFQLLNEVNHFNQTIVTILGDPNEVSAEVELSDLRRTLFEKEQSLKQKAILSESIIQDYVGRALNELGLAAIRQPFPPVLYHVTDLPQNLILSPRDVIKQEKSVSLDADLPIFDIIQLEDHVEDISEYSALVVQVGGVSTFPSMVISTTSLPYLLDTVAHEWIHHFLSLRPLGIYYSSSPQLRTMNETAASIAGQEISNFIINEFFSDLVKPSEPYSTYEVSYWDSSISDIDEFNFRQEMYQTRLRVDELLREEKIEEAEEYMEERRILLWENGYQIRKLNQAYFAFHGAYADQPFSAAGPDPVGEDVRALRARSRNLANFIHTISWMSSYDTLRNMVRTY